MNQYTVVIPVLNQLKYTRQCVDSLLATGTPERAILVINNASSDETAQWLQQRQLWHINNPHNLGCGGAWTQGAMLALDSEWVILLNNDVVLGHDFCRRLLEAADQHQLDVVSPAMVENDLDYDFDEYSKRLLESMAAVVRPGRAHGVCFAVRRSVLVEVGFPDTDTRLGGHEDSEFFLRCMAHGKRLGIVGAAVLHHFGSITQKALKADGGRKSLGQRQVFYARTGMSWWQRKCRKYQTNRQTRAFASSELAQHGMTLHAIRQGGCWKHI